MPFPAVNVNTTKATYVLKVPSVRSAALRHHRSSRAPWTPELARKEAKRLLGLVANGNDPVDEKAKARLQAADPLRQSRINISGAPNKG
ncbi:integrase arm-type DNA-binding domain-containing protein [Bradyrhizobium sp. SSUT112]|nr:integrase arm-type DNA-binding domain-containing protein [Bradyrhizobium sp. SSUT112]MDH2356893.1 integrase arm-type DNA-binding domain-containing protein [Bradyrhizobium sp. SSUT112]